MHRIVLISLIGILLIACNSETVNVSKKTLQEELQGVDRLRVRSGGTCHRQPGREKTLLDLRDPKQVAAFIQQIHLQPQNGSAAHCMCCGDPTLEFYRDDSLLATLGFHHGQSLRWLDGQWAGDRDLTASSADFLIDWLDTNGVPGPKAERLETIRQQEKSAVSQERWLTAMPKSLVGYWGDMGGFSRSVDHKKLQSALRAEFPDINKRILALLNWYGSGDGPWSGYPAYESVAEELLLHYDTGAILGAAQTRSLGDSETEGLARLLGGWDFSQQRPDDLRHVSENLKASLLKHSLQSDNEDKRGRAERAFGQE